MANTEADRETVRRIREHLKQKEAQKVKLPDTPKGKEEKKKK